MIVLPLPRHDARDVKGMSLAGDYEIQAVRFQTKRTDRQTKDVAYKTLLRPQLEYASPVWHPRVKTQIQQVEKVQRTAARWTCRRWKNRSSLVK